jgi:hypothetical protein
VRTPPGSLAYKRDAVDHNVVHARHAWPRGGIEAQAPILARHRPSPRTFLDPPHRRVAVEPKRGPLPPRSTRLHPGRDRRSRTALVFNLHDRRRRRCAGRGRARVGRRTFPAPAQQDRRRGRRSNRPSRGDNARPTGLDQHRGVGAAASPALSGRHRHLGRPQQELLHRRERPGPDRAETPRRARPRVVLLQDSEGPHGLVAAEPGGQGDHIEQAVRHAGHSTGQARGGASDGD